MLNDSQGGFTAEQSAVRFEKNYLSLYDTDGTTRQYCWVAQAGRCYIFAV
jgi:hypothetical protein